MSREKGTEAQAMHGGGSMSTGNYNIVAGAGSTIVTNAPDSRSAQSISEQAASTSLPPPRKSGFWSLGGIAKVITALGIAIAAILTITMKPTAEQLGPPVRDSSAAPDLKQSVARLDVEAARASAKAIRKVAEGKRCSETHLDIWARADTALDAASKDLAENRYGSSLDGFRSAAKYYEQCIGG